MLDGIVVAVILSPSLVTGTHTESIVLSLPAEVEGVLWHGGSDSWAPVVIRRGHQYLFDLWVAQRHFEAEVRVPARRMFRSRRWRAVRCGRAMTA